MAKKPFIVAVIPARGGSKRVPKKNIKLLAGKPLIYYTIEAAKKSKYINMVIVSTDDSEIAEVAKKYGAKVIHRPASISGDKTPTLPVLQHAVNELKKKGCKPDLIITLQPTSPFRTSLDIDAAVQNLISLKAESLVSVCKVEPISHPLWLKKIEKGKITPYIKTKKAIKRSQDLSPLYCLNGAIYITAYNTLMKKGQILGKNTIPFIMDAKKSIDIDEEIDFKIAELMMHEN